MRNWTGLVLSILVGAAIGGTNAHYGLSYAWDLLAFPAAAGVNVLTWWMLKDLLR